MAGDHCSKVGFSSECFLKVALHGSAQSQYRAGPIAACLIVSDAYNHTSIKSGHQEGGIKDMKDVGYDPGI